MRLWTQETLYGTTFTELSLEERAIWFELLCLAGDSMTPGVICVSPSIPFTDDQLSKILGASLDLVRLTVNKLSSPDINKISVNGNGFISIINWAKYQERFDKTEYQREYMQRKRAKEASLDKLLDSNKLDSITEEKRREDKIITPPPPSPRANDNDSPLIFKAYEANIGLLSPIIADKLNLLIADFPPEWIQEAITEAVSHNARNLAYITRILTNWKEKGRTGSVKPGSKVARIKKPYNPRG